MGDEPIKDEPPKINSLKRGSVVKKRTQYAAFKPTYPKEIQIEQKKDKIPELLLDKIEKLENKEKQPSTSIQQFTTKQQPSTSKQSFEENLVYDPSRPSLFEKKIVETPLEEAIKLVKAASESGLTQSDLRRQTTNYISPLAPRYWPPASIEEIIRDLQSDIKAAGIKATKRLQAHKFQKTL